MKVVKCVNGHFFDEDKYEQCPHCGGGVFGTMPIPSPIQDEKKEKKQKKEKHKLFGGKKKEEENQFSTVNIPNVENASTNISSTGTEMSQINTTQTQIAHDNNVQTTVSSINVSTHNNVQDECTVLIEPVTPPSSVMEKPNLYVTQNQSIPVSQMQTGYPVSQVQNMQQQYNTPMHNQGDNMQTVAYYDSVVEPVTGWLVCVKGESHGECFELKAGRNNIGRGTAMDVALTKEMSVSRDKHAIIVFDPMNLKFLIQSGDNGLTYVNDELIMGVKELSAYDKIMLGSSYFIFVPFCGANFDWKDFPN